jgi:hypothetical protein
MLHLCFTITTKSLVSRTEVLLSTVRSPVARLPYWNIETKLVEHPLKIQVAKSDSSHLWLPLQKAIQLLIHISALFIRLI